MAEAPDDINTATVKTGSKSQSVLIVTADNVHDLELFYPYYRFIEEGYNVDVATPKGGTVKGKAGFSLENTLHIDSVDPANYDLLYIPGGKAPAELRKNEAVLGRVKQFAASGKPIAAFCHGPQVLVSADLVKGKKLTAFPEVEKEITEAGGQFVNQPVVDDGQFITSRWPGDLPANLAAAIKRLESKAGSAVRKAS